MRGEKDRGGGQKLYILKVVCSCIFSFIVSASKRAQLPKLLTFLKDFLWITIIAFHIDINDLTSNHCNALHYILYSGPYFHTLKSKLKFCLCYMLEEFDYLDKHKWPEIFKNSKLEKKKIILFAPREKRI